MLIQRCWVFFLLIVGLLQLGFADDEQTNCALAIKYVYVINAASGTLEKQVDGDADDYVLTLHNVEKYVDWLKARPDRGAGKIAIDQFIALWDRGQGSFGEVPPNAELVSKSFIPLGIFGGATVHAFVLSDPRYDPDEKTLIFDAKSLEEGPVKEGIYRNLSMYIAD